MIQVNVIELLQSHNSTKEGHAWIQIISQDQVLTVRVDENDGEFSTPYVNVDNAHGEIVKGFTLTEWKR